MDRKKWLISILIAVSLCLWAGQSEGNIVLKTLVVNPSKTKTQKAILKAYLPREVKPEDVVDLGDLKIDYDIEKSLYYVYQEYELVPGESVSRQIEIKDIWVISKIDLDSLTSQAKELVEVLKKTAYFDTAISLQENIAAKSSDILNKQEEAMDALPQTHIAVFRQNINKLDEVKSLLAKLEKLAVETQTPRGPEVERVSVKATWWVILGVIISLGLLSLIFFIIWQRQATVTEIKKKTAPEEKKTEETEKKDEKT